MVLCCCLRGWGGYLFLLLESCRIFRQRSSAPSCGSEWNVPETVYIFKSFSWNFYNTKKVQKLHIQNFGILIESLFVEHKKKKKQQVVQVLNCPWTSSRCLAASTSSSQLPSVFLAFKMSQHPGWHIFSQWLCSDWHVTGTQHDREHCVLGNVTIRVTLFEKKKRNSILRFCHCITI